MDARQITPSYSVSPQIEVEDLPGIVEAGFKRIICNRPDEEIPPPLHANVIGAAAQELGLEFEILPLTHQTMTPENVQRQGALVEGSDGPVLAYCASGTRSTIAWALGQAGTMSADEIIAQAAKAGYDISGLRGALG